MSSFVSQSLRVYFIDVWRDIAVLKLVNMTIYPIILLSLLVNKTKTHVMIIHLMIVQIFVLQVKWKKKVLAVLLEKSGESLHKAGFKCEWLYKKIEQSV